ncbi:CTP pyrophosphohydrolase [Corynebacterium ciconiae DSM 44920]|uniref:(deoxy)nucleoside triphosphate pyrophosphohydrolase n=1 Tax=Corynebacterium ciconiae TaxID=227319 RepID=UPI000477A87E|nr:(deoxy)nucleoside triphosphate pyrophosphohydrolase [Corynebacterium ciconiae]WKD61589.1 CTP pyrophosphohydrolase [Corynebacterium ciconiae DSM 44920]
MKKTIRVTGAVLQRDGKILAAQRGQDKSLGGFWEFPGGKIEEGETPEQSLARELKEELLIDASIEEHITTTRYEYDFAIIELSTYVCKLQSGEPTLTEHEQVRWVGPEGLKELEWAPADIPTVEILATA